ncbi:MAG: hypothetical protein JXR81_03165 [Candidatus Goldbacteria bacterium]|nr:hypothetical protein [Candidatus Goldiibacteriota bacterium]
MTAEKNISIIGTIKESAYLYFKNFPVLFTIKVITDIPILVFMYLTGFMTKNPENPVYTSMFFIEIAAILLFVVAGWNASVIAFSSLYEGKKTSISTAFLAGFKRYFRSIAVVGLYFMIIMGGFFLFIIPGFFFMITYMFALPVAVLEDVKTSPLKMSAALTKDNKWQLLAMFLLVYIAVCGPAFAIGLIGRFLGVDGNANIIYLVVSSIPGLLLGQLFSGVMVVSYGKLKKLKIKKEKNNPENFKGLGTTAGCAVSILIMAVVIAAAVAGIMLSRSLDNFKSKAVIQSPVESEAE